ncbi:MAG: SH3 domain-containing protein, partial [Romboutsia sp.]|nr:SH3 domain-containing protein [Romboutsia sp.]
MNNLQKTGIILGIGAATVLSQGVVSNACEDKTITKEVKCDVLNLRSGASTNHSIVGKLTKGTKVEVFFVTNGWAKVAVGTKVGYVSDAYLKTVSKVTVSKTEKYTVTATSLNIRTAPSTVARVDGALKKGATVDVINICSGWAKIKTNSGHKYVSAQYLVKGVVANQTTTSKPQTQTSTKVSQPVAGNSFINANNVRMRDAKHNVMCLLKKDTKVQVIGTKGDYSEIKLQNGGSAFVYTSYITTNVVNSPSLGHAHEEICGNGEQLVVDFEATITRDHV